MCALMGATSVGNRTSMSGVGVASERPWQDCHRIPHPGARKQGSFPPTPILGCHCQGHSWEVGPLQATELHGKPGELGEPSSGDLWDGLKE